MQPPMTTTNDRHQNLARAFLVGFGILLGYLMGLNTDRELRGQIINRPMRGSSDSEAPLELATYASDGPPSVGAESTPLPIDIPPSAKEIVINVGSNLDPIMPSRRMGPCARAIAVEPIVACHIPKHPQLHVLPAAMSSDPGVTTMRTYNVDALSSSLVKPAKEGWWNNKVKERGDGTVQLVPVVTLSSLLNAIPERTRISLIKTDMQGFDFVAIKEAAHVLQRRVTHLFTEVWFDDKYSYHAENDLCRDWLPFMTKLGYSVAKIDDSYEVWKGASDREVRIRCAEQLRKNPTRPAVEEAAGLKEADVYWVRNDKVEEPFPICPLLPRAVNYTEEEYASCDR
ncbi:hypothetical protein ACHAWF_003768 [Thalassiosira exigua]